MNTPAIGSLFSGYGGLDIAVERTFNARTAWHCEWEDAPSKVLAHHWPNIPNYRDVTTVDWAAVEPVDIITGGFPCQDVSLAGRRAGMTEGTRSNLWGAMRSAVEIIRPTYVVAENVRGLLSAHAESASDMEPGPGLLGDGGGGHLRALGRVLGDLADLGYDSQWHGLRASDVGAPHQRFRVFILATRRDAPHAWSGGRDRRARVLGDGRDESIGGEAVDHPSNGRASQNHLDWGPYAAAVHRWEQLRGPATTHRGGVNADTTEGRPGEDLQGVREDPHPQEVRQAPGGPHTLPGEGTLQPVVREQPTGSAGGYAPPASPTVEAASGLRDVRREVQPARTSRGWEPGEQLHAEPASAVRELPLEAPLEAGQGEAHGSHTDWGPYGPAIRRWEAVLGREAPAPTEVTARGKHRLSPRFTEFMMGLPDGWVTDTPGVKRNDALKMCGNGVVPQQATAALHHMLNTTQGENP